MKRSATWKTLTPFVALVLVFTCFPALLSADEALKPREPVSSQAAAESDAESETAPPAEILNARLIKAAARGQMSLALKLLDAGADLETKDSGMGATPLAWAAFMGNSDMVALLLNQGADVNSRNKKGWTPFLLACAKGHETVVARLLEEKNLDLDAKSAGGWTAFSIAASKKDAKLTKLLFAFSLRSPWAETTVKNVDPKHSCAPVRKGAGRDAAQKGCLKPGTRITLAGIWTKDRWTLISSPIRGWMSAARIETHGLPDRKRIVLDNTRPPPRRSRPTRRQRPPRNVDIGPPEEPGGFFYDPDLKPDIPRRRHGWH